MALGHSDGRLISLALFKLAINVAARFVANLQPCDHVSHVLRDPHWLPIRERISYKVCLMMFNVINGTAPTCMTDMVTRISDLPDRCHLLSVTEELFDVPRTQTVFGSRALSLSLSPLSLSFSLSLFLSVAGPVVWSPHTDVQIFHNFIPILPLNQHYNLIFSISPPKLSPENIQAFSWIIF